MSESVQGVVWRTLVGLVSVVSATSIAWTAWVSQTTVAQGNQIAVNTSRLNVQEALMKEVRDDVKAILKAVK